MSTPITVGSLWVEKRTNLPDDWRRVLRVDRADGYDNGFVEGVGWYETYRNDEWADADYPSNHRRTRMRVDRLRSRYTRIARPVEHAQPVGGRL